MLADLRIALRSLARNPLYSWLAVLTLGLGIAASTVMFTVVDGILLRPLPHPDPGRIVNVHPTSRGLQTAAAGEKQRASFSYPELETAWRESGDVLEALAMAYVTTFTLRPDGGEPERVRGGVTTAALFSGVLKVPALIGRTFTRDDEVARQPVVVLSESYWRERYAADPAVVGSTIRLGQATVTVLGVLTGDPTLGGPRPLFWVLMEPWTNAGDHRTLGIARLRPGVSPGQASDRLRVILANEHEHGFEVVPRKEDLVSRVRLPILILGAASLLLLLISAANVAALHLGRMIDRQGEIAVRRALGASGRQLARQLAVEGMILAAGSAAAGMLLARYGFAVVSLMIPAGLPRVSELALDARILGAGVAVTFLTGLLASLLPLLAFRGAPIASLIGTTRGSMKGRSALQGAVIVGQVALATVLLYGTGLLTRTVNALGATSPGFAVQELTSFALSYAPSSGTAPAGPPTDRALEVSSMLRSLPGVTGVAIADIIPLGLGRGNNDVEPEGYTGDPIVAERRFVSGGYFDVTGMRLVEGRGITEADDRADGPDVVVISEGLARRAWPGQSAVGKRFAFWGQSPFTVVGVAEDQRDLAMRTPTEFAFYVARQRLGMTGGYFLVRTPDPASMTNTIRQRLQQEFPGVAFIDAGPMTRHIETAIAGERFRASLTTAFALCAAFFCALGVYGVIARSVASRTRELGIRMALGADRRRVVRGVLTQGLRLAAIGGVIGIVLAFWGAQFMRTQLWGVAELDAITLFIVAALLVGIALVSALGPAWRAGRVEPTVALRSE